MYANVQYSHGQLSTRVETVFRVALESLAAKPERQNKLPLKMITGGFSQLAIAFIEDRIFILDVIQKKNKKL